MCAAFIAAGVSAACRCASRGAPRTLAGRRRDCALRAPNMSRRGAADAEAEPSAAGESEHAHAWCVGRRPLRHSLGDPQLVGASVAALTDRMPSGAYTTLRTYRHTGFLALEGHFDRLEETYRLMSEGSGSLRLDRDDLRRLLASAVGRAPAGGGDTRVRLTVDVKATPGEVWIATEPLSTPSAEDYRRGVYAVTADMHRDNPVAKDSAFISKSKHERSRIRGRVNEVLMIGEEGYVLEGLSSNFFGIRGGQLYTADEGVLPGLTRKLVLEAAHDAGVRVRLQAVRAEELRSLDEAFISSTSRGVLPVTRIDEHDVAQADTPGAITRTLDESYRRKIDSRLEYPLSEQI